jgi:hypothetical protein
MEKTPHQQHMEMMAERQLDQSQRAAEAAEEAAYQAKVQAEMSRQQTEIARAQAEFERNVMILEAADEIERAEFFQDYREDELIPVLRKNIYSVVHESFKEIKDSNFAKTLLELKKLSKELINLETTAEEAKNKFSEAENRFYLAVAVALIPFSFLFIDIISAFKKFDFSSILSIFYFVFLYRYYKSWSSDKKIELIAAVKKAEFNEKNCASDINKLIENINSQWHENAESDIRNAFIKHTNPRLHTITVAKHVNKVQKDFPASCRVNFYKELLDDPNHEWWSKFEDKIEEINEGWDERYSVYAKNIIIKNYFYLKESKNTNNVEKFYNALLPDIKHVRVDEAPVVAL